MMEKKDPKREEDITLLLEVTVMEGHIMEWYALKWIFGFSMAVIVIIHCKLIPDLIKLTPASILFTNQ